MSFSLKDHIYNPTYVQQLADTLGQTIPNFPKADFLKTSLNDNWPQLELKDRMRHLSKQIAVHIGLPYLESLPYLKECIKHLEDASFGNLIFPDYVEREGIDYYAESMDALQYFTRFGSSEFAVRPFIVRYPKESMAQLLIWSQDENHHVRRLASEGCRPRLPWAMALPAFKKDPTPILPILEALKADSEDYVYRSVANNLNDISKDHPELVLDIAEKWLGKTEQTDWLVKHALRTLLKKGEERAMRLFGYGDPTEISIDNFVCPQSVQIGDQLNFSFVLVNSSPGSIKLRVEYAVEYLKKRGTYTRKVFKITEKDFPKGGSSIMRKQWFKDFSTRTHHPGTHSLSLLVNGIEKDKVSFEVLA